MCCNLLDAGHAHPPVALTGGAAAAAAATAAVVAATPDDTEAATALVDALLGDGPGSVFGALARVLATDPALPPLRALAHSSSSSGSSGSSSPAPTTTTAAAEAAAATDLAGSRALAPSPALDAALTRLVRTLLAPRPPPVNAAALRMLDDPCSPWPARAAAVRAVAAAAERELELAAAAAAVAACAGDDDDAAATGPPRSLGDALRAFPYIQNYELLVDAEAGILAGPLPTPAAIATAACPLAAVAATSNNGATTPKPWWQRTDGAGQHTGARAGLTSAGYRSTAPALTGMTVAFCGSGPLPLTGLLLNVRAGARVVLIDIDAEAVAASRFLVNSLAACGLVDADMFDIVHADAANVRFLDARLTSEAVKGCHANVQQPIVRCDAVVLASLVPEDVKLAVTSRLAGDEAAAPELLLVRSAVGLVARLAYHRVASEALRRHLAYCGEWVPRRSIGEAVESNMYVPELDSGSLLLGTIDADVLNSVEVYRHSSRVTVKRKGDRRE